MGPQSSFLATFDFDQTLLDTSALQAFRDRRQWSEIRKVADSYTYDVAIVGALQEMQARGILLAVASTAPKGSYLDVFLKRLPITFAEVLGYRQTPAVSTLSRRAAIKVAQLRALTAKYPNARHHFIGDDTDDYAAAIHVSVPFVHACWGGSCAGIHATHCLHPNLLFLAVTEWKS